MYLLLPILFVFVSKERTSTRVTVLTVSVSFIQWAVHAWRGSVPGIFNYVPFVLLGAVAFARRKLVTPSLPFVFLPMIIAVALMGTCLNVLAGMELAVCVIVAVTLPHVTELREGLLSRTCAEIAKYSYSLYLFHVIAMWLAFEVLQQLPSAFQWIFFGGLLAGMSWLAFHLIENPMIRTGRRLTEINGPLQMAHSI